MDPATGRATIMSRIAGPKPKPRKRKSQPGQKGSTGTALLQMRENSEVPDMDREGHQLFESGRTLQDLLNLNPDETDYVQIV